MLDCLGGGDVEGRPAQGCGVGADDEPDVDRGGTAVWSWLVFDVEDVDPVGRACLPVIEQPPGAVGLLVQLGAPRKGWPDRSAAVTSRCSASLSASGIKTSRGLRGWLPPNHL